MTRSKPRLSRREPAKPYSVPALGKGIDIIELLAGEKSGLLISEIAYRLRRSIGEIFRIIMTLEQRQWLQKDPGSLRYSITYRMMELAHRGTPAQAMSLVAAPVLSQLSEEINQSCHVVVPAGGHGLVVLRQENAGSVGGFAMRVGAVVNLVTSCAGHVLLAFTEPTERDAVFRQIPTPWSVRKSELLRKIARVKDQGYGLEADSLACGVVEISYPIRARDAKVVAALTVPYLRPAGPPSRARMEEIRVLMDQAAQRISRTLASIR